MADPRDTPGWTQKFTQPDESECEMLRAMQNEGYVISEDDMGDIYAKLGGAEHIEMLEQLERSGFCKEEVVETDTIWTLTDWGREAIGL
jgi:hypothetical protein